MHNINNICKLYIKMKLIDDNKLQGIQLYLHKYNYLKIQFVVQRIKEIISLVQIRHPFIVHCVAMLHNILTCERM